MKKPKEGEKMERYSFRLPVSLLKQLKEQAGLVPVSVVIRRLIEKYINGEIDIS